MTTWDELGIDLSPLRGRSQGKVYCPKCHHTRKREHRNERELFVNTETGGRYCHNLGCEWNVKGLYLDARNDPFAVRYVRPSLPESRDLTQRGRRWLEARSIDPDVAASMGVYDDGRAITFPYYRDGRVVHLKHRDMSNKRWWSSTDSEPVFYNIDTVKEEQEQVVICEGELDVLALATVGITNAISVPNGAPDEGQEAGRKLDCLPTGRDVFNRVDAIVLATDNDAPGRQLANELVRRIGPAKCWRVQWPHGTKDANECLENYGADTLAQLVTDAIPEPYKGLIYGHAVAMDVWDSRTLPPRRGISTGIPSLDNLWRPDIGHTVTMAGTPSSGKSAFMAYIAHNMAASDGWRFAFFTPETFPQSEFYREMVQIRTGKPLSTLSEAEFWRAMNWVGQHFILQSPDKPTLDNILELARLCVARHGTNVIVIDPFTNVLPSGGSGNMSQHEFIGRSLTEVNQFKQEYRTMMSILAHPTKPEKKRNGEVEAIGPYDVSGSANWFNMSDEMVMLHRTDRSNPLAPVQVRVWKMRSRYHGKLGETQVRFDIETGRYTDLGTPF